MAVHLGDAGQRLVRRYIRKEATPPNIVLHLNGFIVIIAGDRILINLDVPLKFYLRRILTLSFQIGVILAQFALLLILLPVNRWSRCGGPCLATRRLLSRGLPLATIYVVIADVGVASDSADLAIGHRGTPVLLCSLR